jgi:hypothetical protein
MDGERSLRADTGPSRAALVGALSDHCACWRRRRMNACSGRTFAVPGRFWKAAILPNPAFDADSQIRLDHAGSSDGAFVVICTISASRTHIPVIATRLCVGVGASGNRRARVSRNFGGSIKFSVTFIALPYDP